MPALEIHAEWAKSLADQLVSNGAKPPTDLDDEQRLALAWALKDRAIAAWSSAPSEVAVASDALGFLSAAVGTGTVSQSAVEVNALAQWVTGISNLTRGKMTGAIKCLDDASQTFSILGQAGHAAHAQVPKIMALATLGRHAQAAESGAATQRTLMALGDFLTAAKVSLNLGNLYCQINQYADALRLFEQAEKLFAGVSEHKWAISCQLGAAEVHSSVGDFDTALGLYAEATERARKHELFALVGIATEAVGLLYLARGEFGQALMALEESRKQYELLDMPQNQTMAEKQLADAYLDLRLLPEALALFDSVSARFDSLEMPVEKAWTQLQRGRTLAAMNRHPSEILESLHCAAALFSSQKILAGKASVALAQAELSLSEGDSTAATALAEDAQQMFVDANLPSGHAQANVVLAHAQRLNDQDDVATRLFAQTLNEANALGLLSIQARCFFGIGLLQQKNGDSEAARQSFEASVDAFETQRASLPGDELRSAFLVDQLRPYHELLRIALQAHHQQPCSANARQILVRLECFRARALGERLGEVRNDPQRITTSNDPDNTLRVRLNWLYRRTQKMVDEGEDIQAQTNESRRIERELLERARRRRLTVATDSEMHYLSTSILDTEALVGALAEHEVLIEYGVLDEELFACVVSASNVVIVRELANWTQVKKVISAARFQIETLRYGTESMDGHHELLARRSQAAMKRLHDLVWAPLSALLTGQRKILIVPHDQLGSVQFASLHDGHQFLSENYEFATAPSAQIALRGLSRPPIAPYRAIVLGETTRLHYAAEEVRLVATLFPESHVLVGDDANCDALRTHAASADVLHLACHGQFRSDNPMFSALHFVDAPLTVGDAETLKLKQGIVVLSACETGMAQYSRGDEMMGLVRGFLVAGASRIVASLWPVDDAVTMQFMTVFYRSLTGGSSPSAALRAAQLDVMQTHPHPFYWAAFTLYGGW
jgi:CHAT domain-containing protein/tetratricopeptide (TPR) repeat protein